MSDEIESAAQFTERLMCTIDEAQTEHIMLAAGTLIEARDSANFERGRRAGLLEAARVCDERTAKLRTEVKGLRDKAGAVDIVRSAVCAAVNLETVAAAIRALATAPKGKP